MQSTILTSVRILRFGTWSIATTMPRCLTQNTRNLAHLRHPFITAQYLGNWPCRAPLIKVCSYESRPFEAQAWAGDHSLCRVPNLCVRACQGIRRSPIYELMKTCNILARNCYGFLVTTTCYLDDICSTSLVSLFSWTLCNSLQASPTYWLLKHQNKMKNSRETNNEQNGGSDVDFPWRIT